MRRRHGVLPVIGIFEVLALAVVVNIRDLTSGALTMGVGLIGAGAATAVRGDFIKFVGMNLSVGTEESCPAIYAERRTPSLFVLGFESEVHYLLLHLSASVPDEHEFSEQRQYKKAATFVYNQ